VGNLKREVFKFVHRVGRGRSFNARDLQSFVGGRLGCAPASADRTLRLLRAKGAIDYRVINRAASLYKISAIRWRSLS
jgi:hypothetical protein